MSANETFVENSATRLEAGLADENLPPLGAIRVHLSAWPVWVPLVLLAFLLGHAL